MCDITVHSVISHPRNITVVISESHDRDPRFQMQLGHHPSQADSDMPSHSDGHGSSPGRRLSLGHRQSPGTRGGPTVTGQPLAVTVTAAAAPLTNPA